MRQLSDKLCYMAQSDRKRQHNTQNVSHKGAYLKVDVWQKIAKTLK